MEGLKDGVVVFAGQVATRKLSAGLGAMVPATLAQNSPTLRGIITRGAGAVVTAIATRKLAPKYARMATAGAFSELISFVATSNPSVASFVSGYSRRVLPAVSAYPMVGSGQVSAYPRIAAYPTVGLPVNLGN